MVIVMETQDPGCSMTQELDWRDYEEDVDSDSDLTCLPHGTDETVGYELGQNTHSLYGLTDTTNLHDDSSLTEGAPKSPLSGEINKSMSISDVSSFLATKGIPQKFCQVSSYSIYLA